MPRLFTGLELPAALAAALTRIRGDIDGARWQRQDQLHLTLNFLGNLDDTTAQAVVQQLAALQAAPFTLALSRLHCFGHPDKPRNLWIGVAPEAPLHALQQQLHMLLEPLGLRGEARRFHPHITLARFSRHPGSAAALLASPPSLPADTLPVNQVALYQSTPSSQGSVYTVVARYPLTG
ncbi:MAG: RNA 2',3'-cyclic phosphodiesterase [Marinobacter sp.]|nr:RNA 2',3'-cyclic phosphodiesterase [Marinobacter sp.]